jgi:hypothetical protein
VGLPQWLLGDREDEMVAEIAHSRRRAAALILSGTCTAAAVAAFHLATLAFGADLDYGPLGPQPYTYQPPPNDHGTPPYPSQRYLAPRESPYSRRSYIYQPLPYDEGAPVYPSPPYLSSREGPYSERYTYREPPPNDGTSGAYDKPRYGYYPSHRAPAYPSYRPDPNPYDRVHRGDGYRPDGYADPSYDLYGPRPPAPIGGPPRGWVTDPREPPDNRAAEVGPPHQRWPVYPPRPW